MKNRSVDRIMYADQVNMGGFPVRQPLPTQQVEQIDPFLLLHHADIKVPQHTKPLHAGVGPHPHRGFSPVTFVFKGGVHHRDSRGNDSVIYAGGVQWMNAGRGIIHSERPPEDIFDLGGRQEIIQLWINTPAKHKMDQPVYIPVTEEQAPVLKSEDGLVTGRLFSGQLGDTRGPIPSLTDVITATLNFNAGGTMTISLPSNHHVALYLLDGQVTVETFGLVDGHHLVKFRQDGDSITVTAKENTRALLLSGAPLNEEVVSYGPFVMNTQTQIMEAMRDYQMGKMGVLIES